MKSIIWHYQSRGLTYHNGAGCSVVGNTRATFCDADGDNFVDPATDELLQEDHYYPFGMRINGLGKDPSGIKNKYMYNGKELQDDQLGWAPLDWYDYGARMYDAALGRFNTQDPALELYYDWSPYNYVGCNPIKRTDPSGMIWDVANDEDSQNDVKSLANEENQDYITFDENGRVGLDFGDLSDKKIKRKLKKDKGLALVNDLINAKDNDGNDEYYYYATTSKIDVEGKKGEDGEWEQATLDHSQPSGTEVTDNSWYANLSTTPRGDEAKINNVFLRPAHGYNGSVFIAKGTMIARTGARDLQTGRISFTGYGKQSRPSILYHELRENYNRTNGKMSQSAAHTKSISQERYNYGNLDLGSVLKFIFK